MPDNLSADQALQRLMEGNKRFAAGSQIRPRQTPARRIEVAEAYKPLAAVFGCADARVPPEMIFDQGLGDLFVVRNAGHLVDDNVLASIEYAVEYLHVPLVVVLGHKNCGAVTEALKGVEATGHITNLLKAIQPAVEKVKRQPSTMLDNAIRANIIMAVARLRTSQPLLGKLYLDGKLKVVGAYYDLNLGEVSLLD
jgi:carbonic anhydrase